jgi:hypothetical protein
MKQSSLAPDHRLTRLTTPLWKKNTVKSKRRKPALLPVSKTLFDLKTKVKFQNITAKTNHALTFNYTVCTTSN